MEKNQIVPTVNELYEISVVIKNIFKNKKIDNISINIELDNETLNKVNEDLYYRNNPNANKNEFTLADELNVNINDIVFKYTKKEKRGK